MLRFRCIVLLVFILCSVPLMGQSQEDSNQAEEVAKKLANPNANLGFLAFLTDFTSYRGNLPDASSQMGYKMSFQPSLPYSIGESTNIFFRPLIPVVLQQPVYTIAGFENRGVALGDIGLDLF